MPVRTILMVVFADDLWRGAGRAGENGGDPGAGRAESRRSIIEQNTLILSEGQN